MQPGRSPRILPEKAIAGRSRAVEVNHGSLRSGRLFIELPDGIAFEAARDHEQVLGQDRFAWVGHAVGRPDSRVIIGVSEDATAGTFSYQGRLFKLEPRPDGSQVVSEVEPTDPAPELDPVAVFGANGTVTVYNSAGLDQGPGGDSGPIMDVLVAYTPAVQAVYGQSGAEALIIQAVAEANRAYANSGISARLNLVQTVFTNYVESGDMYDDLARLRDTGDGFMDELHTLRDAYGADLVSLVEHEPQTCGIAYQMATLSSSFASSAFSVVHHSCAMGYYSLAHEIGHNLGAAHDHDNAGYAMYPYAYGYQDPARTFRTVMAYTCPGGCRRIDHFSNPAVLYNGRPTGETQYADNTRTINNNAPTIASFRQQAVADVPPGPADLNVLSTGSSTVDLSWADSSANQSGFVVERAEDSADFVQIASLAAGSTVFSDDSLNPASSYRYRVRAWNSQGYSSFSMLAVGQSDDVSGSGDEVTLRVRSRQSESMLWADLLWLGASGDAVDIYRDGIRIATVTNDGSYTDSSLTRGAGSYRYEVCEADSTICSKPSAVAF